MDQYRRGGLVFDVIDAGPADGPVVVLLHGWPQLNTSWDAVIGRLTAQGYRCLAPNQRGYSPGARPTRRRDYRMPELVEDLRALIDAAGEKRVHVVGHDWGAVMAWAAAAELSDRLTSLTALSVPHPAAFLRSVLTSRQGIVSWYMYVFQLPWLPERVLIGRSGTATGLSKLLRWNFKQTPDAADRDARAMAAPGLLTGALSWYRAMPLTDLRAAFVKISLPTLYIWGDKDAGVVEKGARECGRYVTGEYRFEILHGVSHWSLDECPNAVADLLLDWFAAHPV